MALAFGLVLAVLCPESGLAQPSDDLDAATMAADEYEALITALDEFGLDLDSPEFEGMDEGEVWGYIERRRRERDGAGQNVDEGE